MELTKKVDLLAFAKGKPNLICDYLNKPVKFYAAFSKGKLIELYCVKEEEIKEEEKKQPIKEGVIKPSSTITSVLKAIKAKEARSSSPKG